MGRAIYYDKKGRAYYKSDDGDGYVRVGGDPQVIYHDVTSWADSSSSSSSSSSSKGSSRSSRSSGSSRSSRSSGSSSKSNNNVDTSNATVYDPYEVVRSYEGNKVKLYTYKGRKFIGEYDKSQVKEVPGKILVYDKSSSSSSSSSGSTSRRNSNSSGGTVRVQKTNNETIYNPNEVERVYSKDRVVIKKGNQVIGIYNRDAVREEPGRIVVSNDAISYGTYSDEHYTVENIGGKTVIYNKKRWDGVKETEKGDIVLYKTEEKKKDRKTDSKNTTVQKKSSRSVNDVEREFKKNSSFESTPPQKNTNTTQLIPDDIKKLISPVDNPITFRDPNKNLVLDPNSTKNHGKSYSETYREKQMKDLEETFGFLSPTNLYEGPVYYGKKIGKELGGDIGEDIGTVFGAFTGTLTSSIAWTIEGTGHAIGTSLAEKDIRPVLTHGIDMVAAPFVFGGEKIEKIATGTFGAEDLGQSLTLAVPFAGKKKGKGKTKIVEKSKVETTTVPNKGNRLVDAGFKFRDADGFYLKEGKWEPFNLEKPAKPKVITYEHINLETGKAIEGTFKKTGKNEVKGIIREYDLSKTKPEVVQYKIEKFGIKEDVKITNIETRPGTGKTGGGQGNTVFKKVDVGTKKKTFNPKEFLEINKGILKPEKGTKPRGKTGRGGLPETKNSKGTVQLQRTKTETKQVVKEIQIEKTKTKQKTRTINLQKEKTGTGLKTIYRTKTKQKPKQALIPIVPQIFREKTVLQSKNKLSLLEQAKVKQKPLALETQKPKIEYKPLTLIKPLFLTEQKTEVKYSPLSLTSSKTQQKTDTFTDKMSKPPIPAVLPKPKKKKLLKKGSEGAGGLFPDPPKFKKRFIQEGKIGDLFK